MYVQFAFYGVSQKFLISGRYSGPKNKKMQKNGFSTIIFIFYSHDLKNQYRSLKYIFLKSSIDRFCNLRSKFHEYKQKRVQDAKKMKKMQHKSGFSFDNIHQLHNVLNHLESNNQQLCISYILISYINRDYDSRCQSTNFCYKKAKM